ncbi:MAG: stalk domain-containing protein [Bacillota bacterium]
MTKMLRTCVFLLILVLSLTPFAQAAPQVVVDGTAITFDVPPLTEEGRTLVPLRVIFEALGAQVEYKNGVITAAKDEFRITLTIGGKTAYRNGRAVTLDVPAKTINGRTVVPLRFVGEALGAQVAYKNGIITITSASPSSPLSAGAAPDQITVHFIDVGQGDAIYIELPENNDILIDSGDNPYGQTVVSYLKNKGVDDIELLIATHPHADHIGGLDNVLAAFVVEEVVDSGITAESQTYRDYWAAVQAEKCKYQVAAGQSWTFGSAVFKVLNDIPAPLRSDHQDINDISVVTLLDCGNVEFLFTGDLESTGEARLLSKFSPCEILKVGHHGSTSSTSQAFLNVAKPEVAVVSVGTANKYKHPASVTLQTLNRGGIKVYRTDLHGTVKVTTDGKTFSVSTQKTAQASAVLRGGDQIGSVPSITPT